MLKTLKHQTQVLFQNYCISPVDWAGPGTEISPHSYFFKKNRCVHMRRQGSLVTAVLGYRDLGNRAGKIPI